MTALLGPEFDAFLFAPLEEQSTGRPMSVLSALARLDVDPWREAAELAQMPREAAHQRLTMLFSQPSVVSVPPSAPAAIADRLVKLLPRGTRPHFVSQGKLFQGYPTQRWRTTAKTILVNLVVVASVLLAQWALMGLRLPATGMAHAAAPQVVAIRTLQASHSRR